LTSLEQTWLFGLWEWEAKALLLIEVLVDEKTQRTKALKKQQTLVHKKKKKTMKNIKTKMKMKMKMNMEKTTKKLLTK